MTKRTLYMVALAILLLPFLRAVPAVASGDKIVPHVVNGLDSVANLTYRTKFDITNLGPDPSTPITKVTVLFRKTDGTPWTLATDQGTVSEVPLNLGAYQTIRITTLGNGVFAHGYVIVRNLEATTAYAEDYEVAITVYYEVLSGNNIVETVSVPLGQPTVKWGFPVEIDSSKRLDTGFAIADLSGAQNQITLQLMQATTPTSNQATSGGSATLTLNANEKQARMLTEFFPSATKFKGMLFGQSIGGPVAILALEITPVQTGSQYATMVPAYIDSLRRNTMTYLPQGYSLDADLPVVDYLHNENDPLDQDLETPWDVLFQTTSGSTNGASRSLVPQQGATLSIIGIKDGSQFDGLTQEYLRSLNYTGDSIDLSDGTSSQLQVGFTFAIKTGLGHYVKVRIRDYVGYSDSAYKDMMLEIFVYK
jgi:hypothetical protein